MKNIVWKRLLESAFRWRWCLQRSQLTKFFDDLVVEGLRLLKSGVRLLRRVESTRWEEFSSVGVEICSATFVTEDQYTDESLAEQYSVAREFVGTSNNGLGRVFLSHDVMDGW